MNTRVVITGIGVVSAAGFNKASFWNSICRGISAIKPVCGFNTNGFNCHNAAEISGFKIKDWTARKSIRNLDRITQFAIAAANLAIKDSRLTIDNSNTTDTGIILGSMYAGLSSIAEFHRQMLEYKAKRVNPLLFPATVPNAPSSQVAIELGLQGINNSISTGFSSGSDAIGWGLNYLRGNKAEIMLCGGIEELSLWLMGSFDKLGYLSENCCPFSKNRNGLVLGEGSAILVMETMENANQRDADIYAEILGYGCAFNARETGQSMETAILNALEDARITPQDIDYINAEGNSTIKGDVMESNTLKKVLGNYAYKIPVSSIKPVTGHCLGTAGAFNAAACVLALQNQVIPPTINYAEPDPDCDLDYVPNKTRNKAIKTGLSLSCDPDGNSACLIFKKNE